MLVVTANRLFIGQAYFEEHDHKALMKALVASSRFGGITTAFHDDAKAQGLTWMRSVYIYTIRVLAIANDKSQDAPAMEKHLDSPGALC